MGGAKANALIRDALVAHPLVSEVKTTKPGMALSGFDLLIVEAPTGKPFIEACAPKFTYVLRHGDTPIGDCAYELFDGNRIEMLVPTHWAARSLPRVPYQIQYMALEPPPFSAPNAEGLMIKPWPRVLHARAFDWMKDTSLALSVAMRVPSVEFVFRKTPNLENEPIVPFPLNVTVQDATSDAAALWEKIGALLVTSRAETFSMMAYEALSRGIAIVYERHLGGIREWADPMIEHAGIYEGRGDELPGLCTEAVETAVDRAVLIRRATQVHQVALSQLSAWLEHAIGTMS